MNLEHLDERDCETLALALDSYEREPVGNSLFDMMMERAFDKSGTLPDPAAMARKTNDKIDARRSQTIILRAKLELMRRKLQQAAIESAEGKEPA